MVSLCCIFACTLRLAFEILRLGTECDLALFCAALVRSEEGSILPRHGESQVLIKGAIGGILVVMTATNVSRMAHLPSAAVQGSYFVEHGSACLETCESVIFSSSAHLDYEDSSHNCHSGDEDSAAEKADERQLLRILQRGSKKDGDGQ